MKTLARGAFGAGRLAPSWLPKQSLSTSPKRKRFFETPKQPTPACLREQNCAGVRSRFPPATEEAALPGDLHPARAAENCVRPIAAHRDVQTTAYPKQVSLPAPACVVATNRTPPPWETRSLAPTGPPQEQIAFRRGISVAIWCHAGTVVAPAFLHPDR